MNKTGLLLLISLCFCRCTGNDVRDAISTSIGGNLILEIPKEMNLIEGKGIDSYVAYIVGAKDTIHVEYGNKGIIYDLRSETPPVFLLSQKEHVVKTLGKEPSSDDVLFSSNEYL